MVASEEAVISRKWTRVNGLKNKMRGVGDQGFLCACVAAPKNENDRGAFLIENGDDSVGEYFPAVPLVALRRSLSNGQRSVEQEYALLCPAGQLTAVGCGHSVFEIKLLENVFQRGWGLDTALNREAQPVRLALSVIGILAEYHDSGVAVGGVF